MCRLTLIVPKEKTPDNLVTLAMLQQILVRNSYDRNNQDGTGLIMVDHGQGVSVTRSVEAAYDYLVNDHWAETMGQWRKKLGKGRKTFIGHVRAATPGIPVKVETTHPFLFPKSLVGAHNGFIRNKEDFDPDEESDSRAFFSYLHKNRGDNALTYTFLKESLEKANAAFCMLISDLVVNPEDVWVVVGKDRELYVSENPYYLIVNTTPEGIATLGSIKFLLRNLDDGREELFDFPKATKLKANTIFQVNDGALVEMGEVKEKNWTVPTKTTTTNNLALFVADDTNTKAAITSEQLREIVRLMIDAEETINMTPGEKVIMFTELGYPLKRFTEWFSLPLDAINEFLETVTFLEGFGMFVGLGAKYTVWRRILKLYSDNKVYNTLDVYLSLQKLLEDQYEVQFPYYIHTIEELIEMEVLANDYFISQNGCSNSLCS